VNLTRAELEAADVTVLDFNPWMFSGAEQLVDAFFVELAAQLKLRPGLAEVGKDFEEYGEAFSGIVWLPVVGPWIERARGAMKILAKILQRRKEGIGGRRAKVEKALASLPKPIVVVLDDIDRLSTSDIRHIFQLVRLTASFPNIVYFVAFDRTRVEHALSEEGVPGRDYLEKILQVAVDIPAIPGPVLSRQIAAALNEALGSVEEQASFEKAWPDLFMEIVRPLIRNMRDVRRYAAAVHGTVTALQGEIALADVLALEAVRVFLPDVFALLHGAVRGLTTPSSHGSTSPESPQFKAQIEGLLAAAGSHTDVVRAMVTRLFPAGRRHLGGSHFGAEWRGAWRRDHRVAHDDFLRLYLERSAGDSLLAFRGAELAWARMADGEALGAYLRSLDMGRLEDIITSLEAYEDQFSQEHIVPAVTVLLNLLPELPERQRGMFELDTRLIVGRVVYRLLRSPGDPNVLELLVRQILPSLGSLSAKLQLLTIVGYRENAGHKLISEAAAADFDRSLRDEVRATSVESLVQERDLALLLLAVMGEAGPSEPPFVISEEPEMTLALLKAARGDSRSQSVESRAIRRSARLAWDSLIELYGSETILRNRINALKATDRLAAPQDLLDLADRYLGGWRPGAFEDE
jgi:hypothetical protein